MFNWTGYSGKKIPQACGNAGCEFRKKARLARESDVGPLQREVIITLVRVQPLRVLGQNKQKKSISIMGTHKLQGRKKEGNMGRTGYRSKRIRKVLVQNPTPVLLSGKSYGRRSLVGCYLWGCTESDMTEVTQQQQQQYRRLPWWLSSKESTYNAGDNGFDPWVRKMPWRRKCQPTPVILPRKSHGQRSLVVLQRSPTQLSN